MEELKPCPFCGGRAKINSRPTSLYCEGRAYQVQCTFCGATIPEFWNQESVIKAWNRRESEDNNNE